MSDRESYRTSHTSAGYGEFYDSTIFAGYAGDLWHRYEEPMLTRWLRDARSRGATTALDFACGTGRITEVVRREIPTVVGVDVSAEMLERARDRCPDVTFVERDITTGDVGDIPPADVITAFRFFQNAEPELRHSVLDALGARLATGGELIVNVQCNGDGPAGLVDRGRRRFLQHDVVTMSHAQLDELLGAHGFRIVETSFYGFWPRTGPYLSSLAARLQRPASAAVRKLSLPERRCAQMFAVRATQS